MIIRGLTLWQPHASLIQLGKKIYETRGWKMPTGIDLLAIHAGQKLEVECLDHPTYVRALASLTKGVQHMELALPRGAILCVCSVKPSIPTTGRVWRSPFGNFSPGRYAWPVEPILICQPPIRCNGHQGIWKLAPEIERVLLDSVKNL